jgi:hypothetical protein
MPKLKPGTIWLTKAEEVRKQSQSLKGDLAKVDALCFTEEAATHVEGWSQRIPSFSPPTDHPGASRHPSKGGELGEGSKSG